FSPLASRLSLPTQRPPRPPLFPYPTLFRSVPVTLKEYLTLMEALEADLASRSVEDFYYLSRATLVKDERHLDRFDQVFGHVFKRSEEHTSELQSRENLVCRLLLEKKKRRSE